MTTTAVAAVAAALTLAAAFDVRLLHCSQLGQIGAVAPAADPDPRLAA